jgi:hypothetical protein
MVPKAAPVQIVSPGLKSQSKTKNINGYPGVVGRRVNQLWCLLFSGYTVEERIIPYYTWSSGVTVPSSELAPPAPRRHASECVPPLGTGEGGATLAYG